MADQLHPLPLWNSGQNTRFLEGHCSAGGMGGISTFNILLYMHDAQKLPPTRPTTAVSMFSVGHAQRSSMLWVGRSRSEERSSML